MSRHAVLIAMSLILSGCLFSKSEEIVQPPVDMGSTADASDGGTNPPPKDTGVRRDVTARPDVANPSDVSVPDTCGDGLLQPEETCDPMLPDTSPAACADACDDGIACTADRLVGTAETCDVVCVAEPIEACVSGDGCCAAGCTVQNDTDCDDNAVCGDAMVTGAEACDVGITAPAAGACPLLAADCPPQTCKAPRLFEAQTCLAVCAYSDITLCVNDDGCCPTGCDESNDRDCSSMCGNTIIEPGETCDAVCPTACDDGNVCTNDVLLGDPALCTSACTFGPIGACTDGDGCCPATCDSSTDIDCSDTCGNGVLDAGETCDPSANCPADCDDANSCTTDALTGSVANCNVVCTNTTITACDPDTDGCCPSSCNANTDGDCAAFCGNDAVESGEECDGNCPMDCDDLDACTTDTLMGSDCTRVCQNDSVTSCVDGDGCCAPGCNANNDNDCSPVCPNNITEPGEACDGNCPSSCADGDACTLDLMMGSAAQCDVTCSNPTISACNSGDGCCPSSCNASNDNDCSASCGDGTTQPPELCDGDCPTSCAGACRILIGSSMGCDAQCVDDPGCQICNLADPGNCICQADEECNNGTCMPSGGNSCLNACDTDAYCGAYTPGSVCGPSGACIECTSNADCFDEEACQANICVVPNECGDANVPGEWCNFMGLGDACDQSTNPSVCYYSCSAAGDCAPEETCNAQDICEVATSCLAASKPNAWCEFMGTGDTCDSVGAGCYYGCNTACDCPSPELETCQMLTGGGVCLQAFACDQVCAGLEDLFCEIQLGGPPAFCAQGTCKDQGG